MPLLGRTGVEVSPLCFGTMSFGGDADEAMSERLYRRCREAGVNFFDCANVYAGGASETILGKLISGERDALVLTSKVGFGAGGFRVANLSRRNIVQQCEASLRRLKTDRLDVYFLHTHDLNTPMEQSLRALDDLVRAGKILYPGVSNWAAWEVALSLGKCDRDRLAPFEVMQPMYNLVKRQCEVELLPLARHAGMAVMPYSPLGGGLLTGKYAGDDAQGRIKSNRMYASRYRSEEAHAVAATFAEHARQSGHHPATLAVAWVASHPAVTAPIIGARNVEQLEHSLAAASLELSDEQRKEITKLAPSPGVATDRTECDD